MTNPEHLRESIDRLRVRLKSIDFEAETLVAQVRDRAQHEMDELTDLLKRHQEEYRPHCDHPEDARCNWMDAQECLICGQIFDYDQKAD